MHPSVMTWIEQRLSPDLVKDRAVLEVGSKDENGSVRRMIEDLGPSSYVGIDIRDGLGVDVVLDIEDAVAWFGPRSFDLIVCTEMLEHAEDWQGAVLAMKRLLSADGTILLTTRGRGFPYHPYPEDYWRFSPELMWAVFGDFEFLDVRPDTDPLSPGVFVQARSLLRAEPAPMEDI